jgi:acyl-CoA thioester hydrolase
MTQEHTHRFRHKVPVQVRFTDIDMMHHVTNSMYLAYCDLARMKYFNDVLEEKIGLSEESLVIASVTIDFMKPIFMDEKIEVLTKTTKIGNKSVHTLQQIVNSETSEIKAEVKSVVSGFNYKKQHAIVIPDKWKNKLVAFDNHIEFKTS